LSFEWKRQKLLAGGWKTFGLENRRKTAKLLKMTFAYWSIPPVTYSMEQREVAKWEDRDNDIVALAKHMCRIMMDMADFIKGRGKLKTTQVHRVSHGTLTFYFNLTQT
jgi:hypothetical protein